MAGVVEGGRRAAIEFQGVAVVGRFEAGHGPIDVFHAIQDRLGVTSAASFLEVPFSLERGVFRLDLRRIAEDQLGEVGRGRRGEDLAAETLADQLGNQSAMVEMGMGQQQNVDLLGLDRAGLPVAVEKIPLLKHPAIDEDSRAIGFEVIPRAGHLPVGAEELQPHSDPLPIENLCS